MQIAPRTFYAWCSRGPSRRALWDAVITELLASCYEPDEHGRRRPEYLYGAVKMWAHLNRQGIPVARCTVERLMRAHGWRGVRRDRRIRTTVRADVARAADLVKRRFHAPAPNRLFVADFTYVPITSGGFAYTAFVIDAYAGKIVGWHTATHADHTLVGRALADALETRQLDGHPSRLHHRHPLRPGDRPQQHGQLLPRPRLRPHPHLRRSCPSIGDERERRRTSHKSSQKVLAAFRRDRYTPPDDAR